MTLRAVWVNPAAEMKHVTTTRGRQLPCWGQRGRFPQHNLTLRLFQRHPSERTSLLKWCADGPRLSVRYCYSINSIIKARNPESAGAGA